MMIVVGIKKDGNIFESQSYNSDKEKDLIITAISNDAVMENIVIDIMYMTDTEFEEYLYSR